jgi:hypothetical protein
LSRNKSQLKKIKENNVKKNKNKKFIKMSYYSQFYVVLEMLYFLFFAFFLAFFLVAF